jgi:hypothetical protein
MAKIFISFFDGIVDKNNPNAMSCHYESLLMELKKAGNDVLYFNHKVWNKNFGKAPSNFIEKIKLFNPDFIISFDNRCFNLAKDFDCPIIIWEADSFLYFSNIEDIKKNPNRYIYIVGQSVLVEKIKSTFSITSPNVYYLPSATSICSENLPQKTNISFIGTKFNSPDIVSEFMHKNPSKSEINQFKQALSLVEKYPFLLDQEVFKKLNITSTNILDCFTVKSAIATLSVKNRTQILATAADLGLEIYGPESWMDDLLAEPNLVLSYQNRLVYTLKQNQDIYNSSKISININHAQAQTGFSWRVCDIMASNSCIVTDPKKDLELLFPNIKIPTFNNRYDAYRVCKKLLKDENLRYDIVKSCQEIINKKYRYSHLFNHLSQILGIKLVLNKNGHLTRLIQQQHALDTNVKFNFRAETRFKLMYYSTLMIINQIPFINKPLLSRDAILNKISNVILFDNKNKTTK